jgi:hypothetical protein
MNENLQNLTTEKAAKFLGIKPITLIRWRYHRKGPAFTKLGQTIIYTLDDLKQFLADCRIDPRARCTKRGSR